MVENEYLITNQHHISTSKHMKFLPWEKNLLDDHKTPSEWHLRQVDNNDVGKNYSENDTNVDYDKNVDNDDDDDDDDDVSDRYQTSIYVEFLY